MESLQNHFHNLKDKFVGWYYDNLSGLDSQKGLLLAIYTFFAFLAGLIFKNYGRYLIFSILIVTLFIYFGEYLQFMKFDLEGFKAILGLESVKNFDDFFAFFYQLIKSHVLESILIFFGFYLGWKLG